jgi:hypothetical protein
LESVGVIVAVVTHGASIGYQMSPTYRSWAQMKQRCLNPKHTAYKNYGGRGITVCAAWVNDYSTFFRDMGERPSLDHSIDRIDNNGNYEPGNCRWATRIQQGRNRRDNRLLLYKGETKTLSEWSELLGISGITIGHRLDTHGWSVEKALSVPALETNEPANNARWSSVRAGLANTPDRFCPTCNKVLVRRQDERPNHFLRRAHCDKKCYTTKGTTK